MTFDKIDVYVDMTYGVLLFAGLSVMLLLQQWLPAVTFGIGVFLAYSVHIGWRIARFDPESKSHFEETMESAVEDQVEESMEVHVGSMQNKVEQTVEDAVEDVIEDH